MFQPKVFILDVDGVMTDGSFLYDGNGKFAKRFGADDSDALSLLKKHLEIRFVSGDHRGFEISHKRIAQDMKVPLDLVSTVDRLSWISERYDPATVIYMGDGIFDAFVFQGVGYSISVADSLEVTKRHADFVTTRQGGSRAVAEAVLHILATFFEPFDPASVAPKDLAISGRWGKVSASAENAPALPNTAEPKVKVAEKAPNLKQAAAGFLAGYASQKLDRIEGLLAEEVWLSGRNFSASGKEHVLATFQSIFSDAGRLEIQTRALHQKPDGVLAELVVAAEGAAPVSAIYDLNFDAQGSICGIGIFSGGTA